MHINELMDRKALGRAVEDGYVSMRLHPEYPYRIFNYTPKAQYENLWNDITMQCRGLILDAHDRVVFKPPRKFFNYGQPQAPKIGMNDRVTVMDKLDGSLICLFTAPNGNVEAATRGSFTSQQAIDATNWLREHMPNLSLPSDTFSFYGEWIGPSNRIVLAYPTDQVVLLGAVSMDNYETIYTPQDARLIAEWTGTIADTFVFENFQEVLEYEFPPETEGFVIRHGISHLIKVKSEDYLRLHRLIFNLNDRRIWEQMRDGLSHADIVKDLPDEFQEEVTRKWNKLMDQKMELYYDISQEYSKVSGIADRKEFALAVRDFKHRAAMFMLKDQKPINDYVWKLIEPRGEDSL